MFFVRISFHEGCRSISRKDIILKGFWLRMPFCKMRSQVYYLSLASCLSGRSSKEGPRVLGMAFCLSHTSILQDDASGVFDMPALEMIPRPRNK
jgi:hypothetical protein